MLRECHRSQIETRSRLCSPGSCSSSEEDRLSPSSEEGILSPSSEEGKLSPDSTPSHQLQQPVISFTRPSFVSETIDNTALNLLRKKFAEQSRRTRASSLSLGSLTSPTSKASKSEESSPRPRRRSFKVKLFRATSAGVEGYEPLNSTFADEANLFSKEKVTSLSRALNPSPSSSIPSSPRPYRSMTLVPANHRIIQQVSSCSEDSDEGESSLDFGLGQRSMSTEVSGYS